MAGMVRLLFVACLLGCGAAQAATPQGAQARQPAAAGGAPQADGLAKAIDAVLEQQRSELHLPGIAFAVVQDGRVVYARAFGVRDVERQLPATIDTVFPIGSATKPFTSMAVALAQDRGLLSLEDHPRAHLSYFRMVDPEADQRVTIRSMLSHRTGLRAYADLAAEPGVLTRDEYVRAATAAQPAAPFGVRFQYSNAMYSAVGEIVGKVDGSTWERVVERQIFAPLGMKSSVATLAGLGDIADHAKGHVYDPALQTWRAVPPPKSLGALAPGGAIGSSARDMTRWLRMLTARGEFEGRRFVSEAGLREATTPHAEVNAHFSYALGWGTYDWRGLRVVEHNGGSTGISALVSFIPERRVGFVFLANTSPNRMTEIGAAGRLLYPLILGLDTSDTPIKAAPVAPFAEPQPSVDQLVASMIEAAGGERALQRHSSVEIHGTKSYDHQAVTGPATIVAAAPAARAEEEVWTAAGREIGRIRVYFDGATGGQETTFGQDAVNDSAANARAVRVNDFRPLLHLRRLYDDVSLQARGDVAGEPAYVLRLARGSEPPVVLYVSQRTRRLLKRESGGETIEYSDYRKIDGELAAFHIVTRDALGSATLRVESMRFNVHIPGAAFRARAAR